MEITMQTSKGNEGSKVITIYDIAKEAGVSAATVSRVLTKSANVRPEKKEKVMELVRKYNFKPNALAKGLADTKSKVIGILTADVRNPYYAELFVACEQAARKAGYSVLLFNTMGELEMEKQMLERLQAQQVDAIIQMGGRVDDLISNMEYVELVNQVMASVPVVVTGKLEGTQCSMVRIDSMAAMDLLMNHLVGLGHERIAFLGGRMDVLSTYEKILRYKLILKEHNLSYDPELVMEGGYDEKDGYNEKCGYELMNRLFDKKIRVTAVIAVNDFAAAGIMRSILEHGLKIPQDISLVSFDNTYIADLMIPRLTSTDYDYEEFGKALVNRAIEEINGGERRQLITVTPSLVKRESSGAVPKEARLSFFTPVSAKIYKTAILKL
ncbi:MAG: LacI family DNA-binding transcriptional regulator [Firmicutes bacterium]|nr:LacI family DNA-binding transcriptional regulator [Bacillota bacterium]